MNRSQDLLKIALDELRMQMLGGQVLFGFQFQALFQERFPQSLLGRCASAAGFAFIVGTCALLIAAPSIHRIALRGEAPRAMCGYTKSLAGAALVTLALTLASDVLLVTHSHLGIRFGSLCAAATVIACAIAWYAPGILLAPTTVAGRSTATMTAPSSPTALHIKIDYLLTEARVILPGAQALLGFQFIVTMTRRFDELPVHWQGLHFLSLGLVTAAVLLLVSPAAIHRQAFSGSDDPRFLQIGSRIVTLALLPLALAIAADLGLAAFILAASDRIAVGAAALALVVLLTLWYGLPIYLRRRGPDRRG